MPSLAEMEPAAKRSKKATSLKHSQTHEFEDNSEQGVHSDTNAVPMVEGRTMHVGLAEGELANRVVVVGSVGRAELLAKFLEPEERSTELFKLTSDRGYVTITGMFQGTRISVCAVGMGLAMMDFFVRETRRITEGPMAIVRLGTCGILQREVRPGTISVASKGSVLVQRNYAAFADGPPAGSSIGYTITPPCLADAELSAAVVKEITAVIGAEEVVECLNATADSFYSSQGRMDPSFHDANESIHDMLLQRYPEVCSFEMETFMLLHLASLSKAHGIRAAAAAVNVANRKTGVVVGADKLQESERVGGKAIMKALASLKL